MMCPYNIAFLCLAIVSTLVPLSAASETGPAVVVPCTKATSVCEQWVTYASGSERSMVYATFATDKYNPHVKRALIMVHGALRNADHYFRTATAAAFLAGALDDTIVIAPHFIDARDPRQPNEVVWPEGHVSWRDGGVSPSSPSLTSFELVDNLLRKLSDKKVFPNLEKIVIAGHSAGGQFVTRYEMAHKVDGTLQGIAISYVPADPSSYAWPAAAKPLPVGDANPVDAYMEALGENGETAHTDYKYVPFDSSWAPTFNQWPKSLENLAGYTAHMSADQLRKQLAVRPTTYLLGQVDVLPLGGFDSSPIAMAQGPTRRARGEAFVKYVNDTLKADAKIIIVPECGHNDRCIYTDKSVLAAIFPG